MISMSKLQLKVLCLGVGVGRVQMSEDHVPGNGILGVFFRSFRYQSHRHQLRAAAGMSICILADAADIDHTKQIDPEYMSVDDLKE